jgi:hypothetical protein
MASVTGGSVMVTGMDLVLQLEVGTTSTASSKVNGPSPSSSSFCRLSSGSPAGCSLCSRTASSKACDMSVRRASSVTSA